MQATNSVDQVEKEPSGTLRRSTVRLLNPTALAIAFAGALVILRFSLVMGGFGTMMGGSWMHNRASGYGGPMRGGGVVVGYALVCGFLGGALAGSVSALVYNAVAGRAA
jgi:hypothetical protein